MNKFAMRMTIVAIAAAAAACSQQQESSSDAAESVAPNVSPTAAPGVAFDYRYLFGLPDAQITAAQEAHASACETLGITKCRITGMTYHLDERDRVSASLNLSIDAALARGFGKQAIVAVDEAGGRLRSVAITGDDQNPTLEATAARERDAEGAGSSIDTSLNETSQSVDRSILREQARQARSAAIEAREEGAAARAKVTSTPMHFTYEGGGAGRGFAGANPVTEAWYLFVDSLATMVSFGLKALALLLPWLALLLLVLLAFRSRFGRRLRSWWAGTTQDPRYADDQPSLHDMEADAVGADVPVGPWAFVPNDGTVGDRDVVGLVVRVGRREQALRVVGVLMILSGAGRTVGAVPFPAAEPRLAGH